MSETNKSYRIRTDIGQKKSNEFISIDASLVQDYETFDILSVKIDSTNTYKLHNANYGVIVGRVLANNGFGIPNAKISLFIQSDSEDGRKLRELYPYTSTASKNSDGIRYNLLPDEKINDCHAIAGTFPNKRYALDNDVILEVFDKYYKYTTRTNNAGDYLLMGVPVGSYTLHMDLDLSDCGILSQRPRDFVYKGYTIEQFENPNMFKSVEDNNINSLSQIFTQDRTINVQPFWGNSSLGEKIGITRADIDVAFKFEPTCVFIGSVVSDNSSQGITKKCMATENMGYMEEMTTGEGTIEMIRKTPSGDIEEFQIRGTQLIDGNGVWCYQIPMNLDYMMTDEYGNMVPTDDPEKGIPTRTQVRFRMSMQDNEENVDNFFRAKVLVPHNPQILSNGEHEEYDYEFGSMTREDSFRDLFWNNVYSVKSYIPRFQKRKVRGWRDKKFTGFKSCNFYGSNNPMPYNNIRIKLPFMFTIMCALVKILIFIVSIQNTVIAMIGNFLADLGDTFIGFKIFGKRIGFYPFPGVYRRALELSMNVLKEGLCPDLENWFFAPMFKKSLWVPSKDAPKDYEKYDLLKQTLTKLDESTADEDPTSIDVQNNEESDGDEPICLTIHTDYLISCIEMNLAMEYKVINFDFYNDWVNGVLYFPRFMRYLRPKKTFLGITFARAKIKGCMDDTKIFSKTRRYTQQCSIGYKGITNNNVDTFTGVDTSFLTNPSKKKIKAVNNFHKKRGFTQKTIFGKNGGVCHEETTSKGHHVYYMKPCEWTIGTSPNGRKVNLFATDLILLGSLNDCDLHGVPQAFKYLSSTSYILPTNLALTNMDTNGYLYATGKGTICAGNSVLSYEEMRNDSGITIANQDGSISGEIMYYSGTQDTNYDVLYDGLELSDLIALTESAGISWNYTGPGQGESNEKKMYQPGGHFLGLSCTNSQTNIKSCINLSRICEVGANISQRKEDVFEINKSNGVINYKYITPSGFISGDDIVGSDFRTMFATLNQNRLIATKTNPNTGYKMYDFKYVNPINFNGTFKNIVDDGENLYNKKIDLPPIDETVLKNAGIDVNYKNRDDYDPNELSNTQTRTIEDTSADYYLFRFGLDYKESKKSNQKHLKKFLITDGSYQYLPQYENSYYFYFGLKNGVTAIDEFNKQFFSECQNGMLLSGEPIININVNGEINICKATADVGISISNLETPYQFIEIKSDVSDKVEMVTNSVSADLLTKQFIVLENKDFGTYTVTVRDANDVEFTKSAKIGKDVITFHSEVFNFNTSLRSGNLGGEIHRGGYIEVSDVKIPKLDDEYELTLTVYEDIEGTDDDKPIQSKTVSNKTNDVIKLSVEKTGNYRLYVGYKCEGESNLNPKKILMQNFTISDGSSIGLSIGVPGVYNKKMTVEEHGWKRNWWKTEMHKDTFWVERICLFNEISNENLGRETTTSRIYATGGATKCIWGPAQNKDGILKTSNFNVYSAENYSTIPTGYIVDDETVYYPTYAYRIDTSQTQAEIVPNYSALAYKNDLVMGNYYAYLENGIVKYVDKTYFVPNSGYIFKPLPDGELQFHVCIDSNNLTFEGEFENGLFYPSISFPFIDRPFKVKANYFVWQDRCIGVEVDDTSGEEYTAVVDNEMAGKTELTIYNGVTYNKYFDSESFIANVNMRDVQSNNDMIGAEKSEDRVVEINSFYGGEIKNAISGITNFGYSIKEGSPDKTASQLVNSLSNVMASDFAEYATYKNDGIIKGPSFPEEKGNVVDWFLCLQPANATDDNKLLELTDNYGIYTEYSHNRYFFACSYTDKAYYNIEGANVIATVKDPWIGKTIITFPIKNEDGSVTTKQIKRKNKNCNSIREFFETLDDIPELTPSKKYGIVGPKNVKWSNIIENHRNNFIRDTNQNNEGILYGVAVIANQKRSDHYYGNEDMAIYKIYPNLVKVALFNFGEVAELSLDVYEINATYVESNYTIEVSSDVDNLPWTATTLSDWIIIQPSTAVGKKTKVMITVKQNDTNGERSGVVKFSANSTDDSGDVELNVYQSMAVENGEKIPITYNSIISEIIPLDDESYDSYSGSQSLHWFNIEEGVNSVSIYPPAIKINYSIKGNISNEYTEDIEKATYIYLVAAVYDTFGNVIDEHPFDVKTYNGSTASANIPMTFNPNAFQDRRFELGLKWEVKCDAPKEIKEGYTLTLSFDPGETFDMVKK